MSSPRRAAKPVAKSAVKSAVKRTAKTAAKTAGKALRGSVVAQPSPPSGKEVMEGASADARRLAAELERGIAEGRLDMVNAEALQKLIAAACRVYTARVETGEQLMPVPRNSITATDVMVTASGLLRAADLAVFELGMWQSWTGR
jgi:hypothetical protein